MKGLVVLAHGSRVETTRVTLQRLCAQLADQVDFDHVAGAFMQFTKPTLRSAVKYLVSKGCERIVVFPCFLFDGRHVRESIPAELDQLEVEYPEVGFRLLGHIGYDSQLVELIANRIRGEKV